MGLTEAQPASSPLLAASCPATDADAIWVSTHVNDAAPPCPETAGLFPSRCAWTGPLGEQSGTDLRRCALTPARSPSRSPAKPDAGPLKSAKCSLRLDRRASRFASCHASRGAAAARGVRRLRCNRCARQYWHIGRECYGAVMGQHCAPVVPPRSPHNPRPWGEGDLWGDLPAVGRETGSLLRLRS